MDFFYMNFSELFKEKHGINVFLYISNKILLENSIDSSNYIELVFKIAFFDFWGLDTSIIQNLINENTSVESVNVKKLQSIHKNSIREIQKYLESATSIKIKKRLKVTS